MTDLTNDSIQRREGAWSSKLARRAERLALAGIFLAASFLRVYRLDAVPRGVLYDEAYNGVDILHILDGARPIFLTENYGREALFIYLQAVAVSWFGQTDWALRVVAAAVGVLTIPLSYLLVRRLFGTRVALLACAWLAGSLWHVMYSRIGLRTISLPLVLATAFYCLWRGFDTAGPTSASSSPGSVQTGAVWFGLAGFSLGVSLYTYPSARFAPVVVLAFAGYLALLHRPLFGRVLPGLILAGALTILVFAPEGLYFVRHPADFLTRAREVSALNPSLNHGDAPDTLVYSALRSLGMFSLLGDEQWDRNIPGRPIFDPMSSIVLALGLIGAARRAREPRYAFLLLWLTIMLVPVSYRFATHQTSCGSPV